MSARAPLLSTHSGQLERWLGKEACERLSLAMRGTTPETKWYGRPIPVALGGPGRVYVDKGGDFRGRIYTGREASVHEAWEEIKRRGARALRAVGDPALLGANFGSLSAYIAAASTPSKRRRFPLQKVGVTGVANVTNTLWQSAGWPPSGTAGSAAPGGRACDDTTVGAFPFRNAGGGETLKFCAAFIAASVINNTLLLCDRLFDVAKTMNSTGTEAVNGSPARYQSTVATDDDSIVDNFLTIEVQTVLPATAHNWTVCQYTNQAGTTGQTLPAVTGNASAIVQRLDQPASTWFCPLATGDTGIKALTQMQCSAAVASGAINFVINRPLAWIPCSATVGAMAFTDGATTAFERVFDDACLYFLEFCKPTTTATSYAGTLLGVSS